MRLISLLTHIIIPDYSEARHSVYESLLRWQDINPLPRDQSPSRRLLLYALALDKYPILEQAVGDMGCLLHAQIKFHEDFVAVFCSV